MFRAIIRNSAILLNTGALIATMLITSTLGFAYWWVAARLYPPEAVGLASAATSAMMLLSTLFLLGQGTLLLTELPRNKGQEGPLISASLLLVGTSTLLASLLFALLAPYISPQLATLGATPQNIFLFAAGASLASITLILDQAVIALLQGSIQLWRNTTFALAKLALVTIAAYYLAQTSGISIYTTWTIGNLISLIPIIIFLIRKKKCTPTYYRPQWHSTRRLGLAALQHHSLNLILQAPAQLLPLIVTIMLSAKMNAWFYIASMIANFIYSLSISLTTVLHAANAAHTTTLTQKTRLTVGLATLSSLILGTNLILAAKPILAIFGPTYADNAAPCLRLLLLASFPLIIKNHYIAIYRIRDKVAQAILPITLGTLLELSLAAYGAYTGQLLGLTLGWLIALLLETLFMLPTVAKVLLARSNPHLELIATSETVSLSIPNYLIQINTLQLPSITHTPPLTDIDTLLLPVTPNPHTNPTNEPPQSSHSNKGSLPRKLKLVPFK